MFIASSLISSAAGEHMSFSVIFLGEGSCVNILMPALQILKIVKCGGASNVDGGRGGYNSKGRVGDDYIGNISNIIYFLFQLKKYSFENHKLSSTFKS